MTIIESSTGIPDEVAIVFWPAEASRRDALAVEGRPRLLLLAAATPPPPGSDPLEDWLREPFDGVELEHRAQRLAARARAEGARPRLDLDGLLHVHGRRAVLSPAQVPLVALLVERFGFVVPVGELQAVHGGSEVSVHRVLQRCRERLVPLGLALHKVRGGGYQLCAKSDS